MNRRDLILNGYSVLSIIKDGDELTFLSADNEAMVEVSKEEFIKQLKDISYVILTVSSSEKVQELRDFCKYLEKVTRL